MPELDPEFFFYLEVFALLFYIMYLHRVSGLVVELNRFVILMRSPIKEVFLRNFSDLLSHVRSFRMFTN